MTSFQLLWRYGYVIKNLGSPHPPSFPSPAVTRSRTWRSFAVRRTPKSAANFPMRWFVPLQQLLVSQTHPLFPTLTSGPFQILTFSRAVSNRSLEPVPTPPSSKLIPKPSSHALAAATDTFRFSFLSNSLCHEKSTENAQNRSKLGVFVSFWQESTFVRLVCRAFWCFKPSGKLMGLFWLRFESATTKLPLSTRATRTRGTCSSTTRRDLHAGQNYETR